jgi:hypothetical protein
LGKYKVLLDDFEVNYSGGGFSTGLLRGAQRCGFMTTAGGVFGRCLRKKKIRGVYPS